MKYILESRDTGAAINPKYNLGHEGALNRVIVFRNSTVREALTVFKNRYFGCPCLVVSDDEYNFYGIMTEKDINAFFDNNPHADLDSVTVEAAYNKAPKYVITVPELDRHNKNNTDPFENLPPSVSFMPLLEDGKIINFVFNKRFYKPEPSLEEIIEDIKIKGRLDGVNRVGIFFWCLNIGDLYYAISAMDYLCKKYGKNKKFVVITGNRYFNEIYSYFLHNELDLEVLSITLYEHYKLMSINESDAKKNNDFIIHRNCKCNSEIIDVIKMSSQFLTPLIYPKFPDFDADSYINKYDIVPLKTILIVPLTQWITPFPVYFWNFCAEVFKFMGYNVLFNVPDNIADQYNGKNCFVPLKDAVGLADLCGHVFAMRTGFIDFLSTTKANMTIFSTKEFLPIDKIYHIDNPDNRIKTICINDSSSLDYESFSPIQYISNYLNEILSGFKYQLKKRESHNDINNKNEIKTPNIEASRFIISSNRVIKGSIFTIRTPSIYPCKYSFVLEEDTLFLQLYELDLQKCRLDLVLKHYNKVIYTLTDYNILSVIFKPELDGEYKFEVSIYDKKDFHLEFFITDSIVTGGAL
jgi:hypothetical protein